MRAFACRGWLLAMARCHRYRSVMSPSTGQPPPRLRAAASWQRAEAAGSERRRQQAGPGRRQRPRGLAVPIARRHRPSRPTAAGGRPEAGQQGQTPAIESRNSPVVAVGGRLALASRCCGIGHRDGIGGRARQRPLARKSF